MTRGVRLYLVGSFVLVSLAGCGRGFFQSAEREPWRAEGRTCMPEVRRGQENAELGPDQPDFRGPGLRRGVSAQGRRARRKQRQRRLLRREPPAAHNHWQSDRAGRFRGRRPRRRRRIIRIPRCAKPVTGRHPMLRFPVLRFPIAPISLTAPGVSREEDDIDLPPESAPGSQEPAAQGAYRAPYPGPQTYPPREPLFRRGPTLLPVWPRLGPAQG